MSIKQLVHELYSEVCFYGIEDLMNKLEAVKANNYQKLTYSKLLKIIYLSQKPLQLPSVKIFKIQILQIFQLRR